MSIKERPDWMNELENELRDPQNRPAIPPLESAFKSQLRRQLLTAHGRSASSRFSFSAIFRPALAWGVLGIAVILIWAGFSDQGQTPLGSGAERPTETPSPTAVLSRTPSTLTAVAPANSTIPTRTPLPLTAVDVVSFQGHDLITATLAAGEPLTVTLYWEPLTPQSVDWMVYIHLLDGERVAAQVDERPSSPATTWQANRIVTDTHTILLPDNPPPNGYALIVGLYDPANGERNPHMINGIKLESGIGK